MDGPHPTEGTVPVEHHNPEDLFHHDPVIKETIIPFQHGDGGIRIFQHLHDKLATEYRDIPENQWPGDVKDIIHGNPEQLAIHYGLYHPGAVNESAMLQMGGSVGIDKFGNLVLSNGGEHTTNILEGTPLAAGQHGEWQGKMFDSDHSGEHPNDASFDVRMPDGGAITLGGDNHYDADNLHGTGENITVGGDNHYDSDPNVIENHTDQPDTQAPAETENTADGQNPDEGIQTGGSDQYEHPTTTDHVSDTKETTTTTETPANTPEVKPVVPDIAVETQFNDVIHKIFGTDTTSQKWHVWETVSNRSAAHGLELTKADFAGHTAADQQMEVWALMKVLHAGTHINPLNENESIGHYLERASAEYLKENPSEKLSDALERADNYIKTQ